MDATDFFFIMAVIITAIAAIVMSLKMLGITISSDEKKKTPEEKEKAETRTKWLGVLILAAAIVSLWLGAEKM
jgi:succinate dehydrogenase hydrophobic anchor subunit